MNHLNVYVTNLDNDFVTYIHQVLFFYVALCKICSIILTYIENCGMKSSKSFISRLKIYH
jgi:hypothetical protein